MTRYVWVRTAAPGPWAPVYETSTTGAGTRFAMAEGLHFAVGQAPGSGVAIVIRVPRG